MQETERVEVRIDKERKQRLRELAECRHVTASEVIRELIDAAYDEIDREQRRQAVEELFAMEIEDVPEPEELKRQILTAYDLPDLY